MQYCLLAHGLSFHPLFPKALSAATLHVNVILVDTESQIVNGHIKKQIYLLYDKSIQNIHLPTYNPFLNKNF